MAENNSELYTKLNKRWSKYYEKEIYQEVNLIQYMILAVLSCAFSHTIFFLRIICISPVYIIFLLIYHFQSGIYLMLLYLFIKLLAQHRSIRGSLTSTIKKSVFQVFGDKDLPEINAHSNPTDIHKWKSSNEVRLCYERLFKPIKDNDSTYMRRILEKIWRSKLSNISLIKIAYAIGICEALLNPKIERIQISESVMKNRIKKNLVRYRILRNYI